MQPKLSLAEFGGMVRRAGVVLTEAELTEIYAGWAHVEPMLERIRTHGRDRAAEPAMTFDPAAFGPAVFGTETA